jgi:hypothetical protein
MWKITNAFYALIALNALSLVAYGLRPVEEPVYGKG